MLQVKEREEWKISGWKVSWVVTLLRATERIRGRQEDASSIFGTAGAPFNMVEHTVELIQIIYLIHKVSV